MKVGFRKKYWILSIIFGMVFATSFGVGQTHASNVDDFYFDDFTADYYLTKDSDGVSHLRVVENLTAVFPDYKQNKGICREIANRNQGGANITLPRLSKADIKLLRNGQTEPIYSIDRLSDGFKVCTGDESYVTGKQVYTFEYSFEKVITEFDEKTGNTSYGYQELYWDTNGTGWPQKFNTLTARVHFGGDEIKKAYAGKEWCYVGRFGSKSSGNCEISAISDGVEFKATGLRARENLTFDIEFKPGSFVVPEPEYSYALVVVEVIIGIIALLLLLIPIKNYRKVSDKRKYYKGYFVVPQYAPHKEYTLPEMAAIYVKNVKDVKVALLLDAVVNKKIEFIKVKDHKILHDEWEVKVLNKAAMTKNETVIVKLLNGGLNFNDGDTIQVKTRTATPSLVSLGRQFDTNTLAGLKEHGLVESNTKISNLSKTGAFAGVIVAWFCMFMLWAFLISGDEILVTIIDRFTGGKLLIGEEYFPWVVLGILFACGFIWALFSSATNKYKYRTMKGLEMSRYMDGLKLYIDMAEEERIEFLQSKKTVDTSPEGVVHLYEKLLPYAALFGLEKSWMAELDRYYADNNVEPPEWRRSGLTVSDIIIASTLSSSIARSSSTISGSGGSSSGFSGGGGGGFSGGGGGGGGGGGR